MVVLVTGRVGILRIVSYEGAGVQVIERAAPPRAVKNNRGATIFGYPVKGSTRLWGRGIRRE